MIDSALLDASVPPAEPPRAHRRRGPFPVPGTVPALFAFPLAALGGLALAFSYPGAGIWPLAFLGAAAVLVALRGRGAWSALAVGLVGGAAYWGVLVFWLTVYLGPVPWAALSAWLTVGFGAAAALTALATRWAWAQPWHPLLRGLASAVVAAGLWSGREALLSDWPYGGFGWGRFAYSQSESPFADLVSWLGVTGAGFALLLLVAGGVELLVHARRARVVLPRAVGTAVVIAAVGVLPNAPVHIVGSTRVAAVQGDADAGVFSTLREGEALDKQLSATIPVLDKKVDMVVWPEGGSDLDPLRSTEAAQVLDAVSKRMTAPLVLGTVTNPSGNTFYNSSLVWENGKGATATYDKVHLVPFGEYVPDRAFFHALAPSLIDLLPNDFTTGTRSNVVDVNGVKAALSICYDITDDGEISKAVSRGAQIILAQTNTADFGHTDENLQQLEIARMRAIESGRSVVNISTIGKSAIISPTGETIDSLPRYTPGAMVDDVPLATGTTPAIAIGPTLSVIAEALGVLGFLALGALAFIARRRRA